MEETVTSEVKQEESKPVQEMIQVEESKVMMFTENHTEMVERQDVQTSGETSSHKQHTCEICDKSFTTKGNLTTHRKTVHSGEKRFSCDHCNKCFSTKQSLNDHINTHTGERPHTCSVCSKSFTQHSGLTRHMAAVHEGVRYSCNQCDKTFSTNQNRTEHIRVVHLGDKQYICEHCSKRFSQRSNLARHITEVHEENRLQGEDMEETAEVQQEEMKIQPVRDMIEIEDTKAMLFD